MEDNNPGPEESARPTRSTDEDHSERRIWWTIFAVGAAVFVGLVLLGRPLIQGRLDAARNLDRATAMIAGTNGDLAAIDSGVRASLSATTTASGSETLAVVARTETTLKAAAALSQTGYDRLTEAEQKRATIVRATAISRLAVLEAARGVLSAGGVDATATERTRKDYEDAVDKARQADAALVKL